jgi:predicted GNAT family acetyltransferase
VNVIRHKTAREFLERAGEWLERAEAENNLILGISRYFVTNEGRAQVNPYLLTVEENGTLLGAALMTPPRHLIIARMSDPAFSRSRRLFFERKHNGSRRCGTQKHDSALRGLLED